MNQDEEDTNIAFLTLLQKGLISVNIHGDWLTKEEALRHTYKELILDNPVYKLNDVVIIGDEAILFSQEEVAFIEK